MIGGDTLQSSTCNLQKKLWLDGQLEWEVMNVMREMLSLLSSVLNTIIRCWSWIKVRDQESKS